MRISDWISDVCSSDLVEYRFVEPPTSVLRIEDKIRVELCLNTRHRSAQASFVDYWTSEHYERIGELFVVPPTLDVAARADEDRTLSSLVCLLEVAPVMALRSEEHTSELQSLMRISYAVFCLKKKNSQIP